MEHPREMPDDSGQNKDNYPLTKEEADMLRMVLSCFDDDIPFLQYCEEIKALKAKKHQQQIIDKFKIRCFNDAARYFKTQPKETYKEFLEDMDVNFSWDWSTFCKNIISLKKSYLSGIEFVY